METMKAYKYRFYPTEEQKVVLAKTFGSVRYVYNWGLQLKNTAYRERNERLYYNDLSGRLTLLKQQPETVWLNEVSSVVLQQSLRHLDRAFINFFDGRAEYPKFHKKSQKQSATFASSAFKWDGEHLTLAKMYEPLNIRWTRGKKDANGVRVPYIFHGIPKTVTVSKDCSGRYFVSFQVKEDVNPLPQVESKVGLDLGLTHLVILSDGTKYDFPKFFRKDEKKLVLAQRELSGKKRGSKNAEKAKLKVARIHARIADRRSDLLHNISNALTNENQVISAESLRVNNMLRNHHLAKSISDAGWGELIRQLEYKSDWKGRTFVKIDTFYPSSKLCSTEGCGHVMKDMPLQIRNWTCPSCGVTHDRDVNSAINILAAGLAVIAYGEAVRPVSKSRTKASGTPRRSRKASA